MAEVAITEEPLLDKLLWKEVSYPADSPEQSEGKWNEMLSTPILDNQKKQVSGIPSTSLL